MAVFKLESKDFLVGFFKGFLLYNVRHKIYGVIWMQLATWIISQIASEILFSWFKQDQFYLRYTEGPSPQLCAFRKSKSL